MHQVTLIAGARPNFMKIAPLIHAIQKAEEAGKDIQYRLVHTAQHYDHQMRETFFEELNIPRPDVCITLRDNTERPETCTIGTNELIGTNSDNIKPALDTLFAGRWKKGGIPPLWDGHAAERIVDILIEL